MSCEGKCLRTSTRDACPNCHRFALLFLAYHGDQDAFRALGKSLDLAPSMVRNVFQANQDPFAALLTLLYEEESEKQRERLGLERLYPR